MGKDGRDDDIVVCEKQQKEKDLVYVFNLYVYAFMRMRVKMDEDYVVVWKNAGVSLSTGSLRLIIRFSLYIYSVSTENIRKNE